MRKRPRLLAIAGGALVVSGMVGACNFTLDGYQGDPLAPDTSVLDTSVVEPTPDATAADSSMPDAAEASVRCPTGRGPAMVRITEEAASFCIDATEVTNSQYQAFLLSGAAVQNTPQIAACAFNTTFAAGSGSSVDDPAKTNYPVVVVNWCQAYAFCHWANKRLCGKVSGGKSNSTDFGTTKNEFFYACSHGGMQAYNYSGAFNSMACNATGDRSVEPVENRPTCEGGYPGVYDLVGNVGEWQDDCDTEIDGSDHCPDNSSSFVYVSGALTDVQRCDHHDDQQRSQAFVDLGFRCCAD